MSTDLDADIVDQWAAYSGTPDDAVHPMYLAGYRSGYNRGVAAIAEAVKAERERCARICDTTPPYPFRPSIEAAHAIRATKDTA